MEYGKLSLNFSRGQVVCNVHPIARDENVRDYIADQDHKPRQHNDQSNADRVLERLIDALGEIRCSKAANRARRGKIHRERRSPCRIREPTVTVWWLLAIRLRRRRSIERKMSETMTAPARTPADQVTARQFASMGWNMRVLLFA